jgi:hypothetical protein
VGLRETLDLGTAPGTWIGHGALTLAIGIVGAIACRVFGWASPSVGYVLGLGLMAGYYVGVREPLDKLRHKLKGDYDEVQPGGATPRADFVGDTLAPLALFVGGLIGVFL